MDKRYQVFVSSTFKDLQEERQEVMQAILELDCIPSGMELFPAANEDQWTLIKKVIDDSDYYLVILGGRYGSIGPEGLSYTEMEYRYALEKGKPIIGFLHKNPSDLPVSKSEEDKIGKEKLEAFKSLVQKKVVKYWTNPKELGSVVSRSLIWLIRNTPAIGWVRADRVPDQDTTQEILRQKIEIEELNKQLQELRTTAPKGVEQLAQGLDEYTIRFTFKESSEPDFADTNIVYSSEFTTTWDEIYRAIAPLMIDEANDSQLKQGINNYIDEKNMQVLIDNGRYSCDYLVEFEIVPSDFQIIKVQLRALGLITKSSRIKSEKDTETYWTLTPYGDDTMTKLCAMTRTS